MLCVCVCNCVCIGVYVSLCVCVYLAGLWYPPGLVVEAGRVSLSDPVDAPAPRQHGLQRLSDWPAIRFFILQEYDQILGKNWRIRPIEKNIRLIRLKEAGTLSD